VKDFYHIRQRYPYRLLSRNVCTLFGVLVFFFIHQSASAQQGVRKEILLNANWRTIADTANINAYNGFEKQGFHDQKWSAVDVPHNWDNYGGYRRLKHGNLHGYAWYRKTFTLAGQSSGKHYFLWFEGVGSYATVWLNGVPVGHHAGGRTTFTLDVTQAIKPNGTNLLCVRADHPAFIRDLPWVCGADSDDPGFSEGSQPMGIFRPVHLIVTNPVRIEPFGLHAWNDTTVSETLAAINLETTVKDYGTNPGSAMVLNKLVDANGKLITEIQSPLKLQVGETAVVKQIIRAKNVHLWSPDKPYLYTIISQVIISGKVVDQTSTPYGIRWISWPIGRNNGDNRFYVNGKPFFINGIAEYEHLMGNSQAFSHEEIRARVMQLKAAGFNAFRDAHQPHNLEYQRYWEKLGILWWPQYSAHIWYDTPEFRENFKALMRDWIRERRNNPSVVLWGLQNESRLPADFARECSAIIREMDPTASSQRKITTCNGGNGTDWDVPQNWSGTYGGNPLNYAEELKKQILVGEYGAWRSLDLHAEGSFLQNGTLSEDRMAQLMETKVRLAESVKDKVAGQFHWLLYSHENPGRVQGGEGFRELDRVGPINYKGLFTIWGQPVDAFYMFRSNYAPAGTEPMVYIVSHTWPNRWLKPGIKDSITIYSNCDEVELFNDVNQVSLGKRRKGEIGTHFQWDNVDIKYNMLYAVGYLHGKVVAHDYIVLNHLPAAPHLKQLFSSNSQILQPASGYKYLYRVNCGGPDYLDKRGNLWMADVHKNSKTTWGSISWTDDYPGMPAFFGSQQRTFDPIQSTDDSKLFQTFRFGMNKLKYEFPVPDGDYRVELYFTEPWYGTGEGMNCTGWRVFDVAVNGQTVIKNLDIWKEAGYDRALKKIVIAHVTGGRLQISFPHALAGEAIISAIAVSTLDQHVTPAASSGGVIKNLDGVNTKKWSLQSWMDIGDHVYTDADIAFSQLPPILFGANWIKTPQHIYGNPVSAKFKVNTASDVYIAINTKPEDRPDWLKDYLPVDLSLQTDENNGTNFTLYKKRFANGAVVSLGTCGDNQKYTVAVLPVTTLAPAVDLKKSVNYAVDNAILNDGVIRDTVGNKKVLRFVKPGGEITFAISPGVGDKYDLKLKYYNAGEKILTVKMQLEAADGTIMKTEELNFKPVKKNKTGTITTTTGTSINAGNYKVILEAIDADGLAISGLEMQ
jgi:beta-galactosidase